MSKKNTINISLISTYFFLICVPVFFVFAQTENPYPTESLLSDDGDIHGDFVVGPGKTDLTIAKGGSQTVEILVSNRTGEKRQFNLSIEDAKGSENAETAVVLVGNDRGPYSLKDYIHIPSTSFTLQHNERVRIPVTIRIPDNAESGGLYGSVLVDTVAVDAVSDNTSGTAPQSSVVARIGTLFFITIPGEIEKSGSLKDFSTISKKHIYQEGPIHFGILYENAGSIHLAPYGEIRITNILGTEVDFQQIEPWFVFPKAMRLREVSWDREYLFGRYTATIHINRSYDDTIDTMSYSFWVFPWKLIVLSFTLLFGIFFFIKIFLRTFEFRFKRKL